MVLIMLITAFLCLLSTINAYQNGAPVGACDTMMPNHSAVAQPDDSPYTISVEPMSYSNGTNVTVNLMSSSREFKGYLLQMRRMDNQTIIAGFSILMDGQLVECDNQINAAVTHRNNTNKMSVSFTWTAPAQSEGSLHVVATVVENKTTFWTMVKSPTITFTGSSSTTTTAGCVLGILVVVVMTVLIL